LAGRTEAEAVNTFLDSLQRAVACVTRAVVNVQGGYYKRDVPFALTLGDGLPVPLKVKIGSPWLSASLRMGYRVVEAAGDRGPWNVQVTGYEYALENRAEREILAYHWHPGAGSWASFPHVHIGTGADVGFQPLVHAHLRGERATFEDFLWVVIHEMGVLPLRDDWESILDASRREFQASQG
jgi:hypothetical protein